jgi:hypothetical protein
MKNKIKTDALWARIDFFFQKMFEFIFLKNNKLYVLWRKNQFFIVVGSRDISILVLVQGLKKNDFWPHYNCSSSLKLRDIALKLILNDS